jgi:toxin-antitoxin system PIN domain toxin
LTFLLDINVLIALIDQDHAGHDAAHRWFQAQGAASWATCPMTENGVIRIVSQPKYPGTPVSTAAVTAIITRLTALPGHVFWSDNISLTTAAHVDASKILTPAQVTDTYLLAVAVGHRGQLATFDRRLATNAVKDGNAALHLIEPK